MNLPNSAIAFIFYFARRHWKSFAYLVLSFAVWAMADAIFPYLFKIIIDHLTNYRGNRSEVFSVLTTPIIWIVITWCVAEFFMRSQGILGLYLFPKFRADIRETIFRYVNGHSHEYFSSNFAGNLSKKVSDLASSSQTIVEIICFNGVTAFVGTCLVLGMMWMTNPIFAVILMTWMILHFTVIFAFFSRGNKLSEIHSEAVSTLSGKIVDVFSNILNVRLFSRARYEEKYLNTFQDDEIKKAKKALWNVEIMRIGLGINGLLMIFGMIFGLIYSWINQKVTIGDFTQILMQSWWLLGWMWYISFQLTTFARELGTINNALDLIKKGHDVVDQPHAPELIVKEGGIVFKDITFSYHANRPVFTNLNVTIYPGEKVGLVGFSGSGKTTFVNLILRFYDVQSGSIMIDHQNIADVTQDSLRSHIAMIPQDPALFHRTLMENMRYGNLDATDEEVYHVSKLAHCDEFINKLDEKYQALVGERGIKLSGGQRQRIAIARAMLKNAPILILDEATSALDSVTEKLIQKSLHTLMQNKTTIVIAHRLSTLADMDRILVFDKGNIIEEGTKDSLLKTGGHFAKLWEMQTDGFLPES